MRIATYGAVVASVLLWACSSSDAPPSVACVDGDVRCGKRCDAMTPCADGLYCNARNVCAKDCVVGKTGCAVGACMPGGMCPAPAAMAPGGAGAAAAGRGGGGAQAGAAGASVPVSGSGGSGMQCTTVATPMRVVPTVILVVDQSGSMNEDFGMGSRWTALRDSLLAEPAGLISALQGQVNFGLALYSARAEDGPVEGMCPLIQSVAPAPGNRMAISTVYSPADPIDETPTGDAILAVLNQLVPATFDPVATPWAFILATDGEPDSCASPNPEGAEADMAKQKVVEAVTTAFGRGIRTYVISVGNDLSEQHQRAVANAGVGTQAGMPDAEFWRAGDDQTLRAALTAIVGTQISCDIALNGSVTGDPCQGTVMLQGTKLGCGDMTAGWSALGTTHIRLHGAACQTLSNNPGAMLNISFPCGVFLQ